MLHKVTKRNTGRWNGQMRNKSVVFIRKKSLDELWCDSSDLKAETWRMFCLCVSEEMNLLWLWPCCCLMKMFVWRADVDALMPRNQETVRTFYLRKNKREETESKPQEIWQHLKTAHTEGYDGDDDDGDDRDDGDDGVIHWPPVVHQHLWLLSGFFCVKQRLMGKKPNSQWRETEGEALSSRRSNFTLISVHELWTEVWIEFPDERRERKGWRWTSYRSEVSWSRRR